MWRSIQFARIVSALFSDLRVRLGYTYVEKSRRQSQSNPLLTINVTAYRTGDGAIVVACQPQQTSTACRDSAVYYKLVRDADADEALIVKPIDDEIDVGETQHAEIIGSSMMNLEEIMTTSRTIKAGEDLFDHLSLDDIHLE